MREEITEIFKTNLKKYISIGERIRVKVEQGDYRGFYLSRIEDISDIIKISLPTDEEGRYAILAKNTPIFISYFRDEKRFGFNSIVIDHITENKLKLLIVEFPDEIFRIESREFFRVKVNIPTSLTYDTKKHKSLIMDISGGGALIRTKLKISKGEMVKIFIPPLDKELSAKIVRTHAIKKEGWLEYGCSFTHIKERTRDRIVGYCFYESIRQKKLINV